MKHLFLSGLALILSILGAQAQKNEKFFNLIPYPTELKTGSGEFRINAKTIVVADERNKLVAGFLAEVVLSGTNSKVVFQKGIIESKTPNAIVLKWSDETILGSQGYRVDVTSKNIVISANQANGFFMAV